MARTKYSQENSQTTNIGDVTGGQTFDESSNYPSLLSVSGAQDFYISDHSSRDLNGNNHTLRHFPRAGGDKQSAKLGFEPEGNHLKFTQNITLFGAEKSSQIK